MEKFSILDWQIDDLLVLDHILYFGGLGLHETRNRLHDHGFLGVAKLQRKILSEMVVKMKRNVFGYRLLKALCIGRQFISAWWKPRYKILPRPIRNCAEPLLRIGVCGNDLSTFNNGVCGIAHPTGDVSGVHLGEDTGHAGN